MMILSRLLFTDSKNYQPLHTAMKYMTLFLYVVCIRYSLVPQRFYQFKNVGHGLLSMASFYQTPICLCVSEMFLKNTYQ